MELLSIFFVLFFWHFLFCSTSQAADIDNIYNAEDARIFRIKDVNADLLMWDYNTHRDLVIQGVKGIKDIQLQTILYGIVVGSCGVWMFEVFDRYVQQSGTSGVKDVVAILDSEKFKQRWTWKIFGDESDPPPHDGEKQVNPTLATFFEELKKRGGVPTYAFIIQRQEKKNNDPKHKKTVLAVALQLEMEVNNQRREKQLEDLEVQWLPFPDKKDTTIHAVGFGVYVAYKDILPELPIAAGPGQQVEIIFGKEKCLLGTFPNWPLFDEDYHIDPSTEMKGITTSSIEAELAHLWIKNTGNVRWIAPQEGRDVPAGSLIALDGEERWSIAKHNNRRYPTWSVTAVTSFGSWTLLFSWTSFKDYWMDLENFGELVKRFLETGPESITYTWQEALQNFRTQYTTRQGPAKLLDIIIIYQIPKTKEIPKMQFFQTLVLEMLRMVGVENSMDGGTTENPRALDIRDWWESQTFHFLSVTRSEHKHVADIQTYFLVHKEYKKKLSFKDEKGEMVEEAGYILKLFYGPVFRAKWEIGLSGRVQPYPYEDPGELIRSISLVVEGECGGQDAMDIVGDEDEEDDQDAMDMDK